MWDSIISDFIAALLIAIAPLALYMLINLPQTINMSMMGLSRFGKLNYVNSKRLLDKLIKASNSDTEILIVGRTARSKINDEVGKIKKGLKNGVNFKVLVLSSESAIQKDFLTPLQLQDPQIIKQHLIDSITQFKRICEYSKEQKYTGTFEVRTSQYLVLNGIVACKNRSKNTGHIIYDFSFGTADEDKYQQYYKYTLDINKMPNFLGRFCAKSTIFCSKIFQQYEGLFNQGKLLIKYEENKIIWGPQLFKLEVSNIMDEISSNENIRNNMPQRLAHKMASIVKTRTNIDEKNYIVPPPVSVQIEITNLCNARCIHCDRHKWSNSEVNRNEMPTNVIEKLLEDLAKMGVQSVTFSGGEPTLRKDFIYIIRKAKSVGLHVGILSNGSNIDNELAKQICMNCDWIRISVDAYDTKTYKEIRGLELRRVKSSINNLQRFKNKHNHSFKIGISYLIQKGNVKGVTNVTDLLKELRLPDNIGMINYAFAHGKTDFACTRHQLVDLSTKLNNLSSTMGAMSNINQIKSFISNTNNIENISLGLPMKSSISSYPNLKCFMPWLFSLIDAFGDVYPCCYFYYDNFSYEDYTISRQENRLGTVTEHTSFQSIWNGKAYQAFRKMVDSKVHTNEQCEKCTRYFVPNKFFSQIYELYEDRKSNQSPQDVDTLLRAVGQDYKDSIIWF